MKILEIFKFRDKDPSAPYEAEVKYKGSRYIVRAGCVVELVYGLKNDRAEPTNLSRHDYDAILQLAKTNPIRVRESI